MHINQITNFFPFIDDTIVCSLDVVEGVCFLVRFDNDEDLSEFTKLCKKDSDSSSDEESYSDNYDEVERKVVIKHHVKHIPIFICKNQHEPNCNVLLKQHLQSLINFISVRAIDHDDLTNHNTTTWFSCRDYSVKNYEEFKNLYIEECKKTQSNFVKLLPIKIVVKTNNQIEKMILYSL